ncbi:hypothetical protein [Nocardioides mangrovi]|uniref:Uncharacterized protein n=1 Tax=Nocardioides mangrovi TaxID=2874580 RepID=A0ABS7U8U2_9ACTN|nr:hypothetical protein [Nocardioides mangrovi]MBZ5737252.1 hypothetical protein [Nocardioides mangrovi]
MNDSVEPDIAEAVHHVTNRFGVAGLETLIALAQDELVEARKALEELTDGD